jgi:hypothetical protein
MTDHDEELGRWLASVAAALDLDAALVAAVAAPVLDLVRDVAHGVNRPAAPLTAFLVGLSCGSVGGSPTPEAVGARIALVEQLVQGWAPEP